MNSRIALITFLDGEGGLTPGHELPGPQPGHPWFPGHVGGPRPDQGLPGGGGYPSQGLPGGGHPDQGLPGGGGHPSQGLPGGPAHPWVPGHIGFPPVAGHLPWVPGAPARPVHLPVYPPSSGDGSTKPIEGTKWDLRWVPCVGFVLVPEDTPVAGNELPGQPGRPPRPDQGPPPTTPDQGLPATPAPKSY